MTPLVQGTSKKITPLFGQKFIFFGPFYAGPFYAGLNSATLRKLTPIRAGVKRADKVVNLDYRKASHDDDIPTKVIKANSDIICEVLHNNFNCNVIDNCIFPDLLKTANVTPIFKTDSRTDKKNYRPVSILPNVSKIYERLVHNQLSKFFECNLSELQCGFRKGFSAQDCLIVLIETWKRMLDKGGTCGALLTDLSKAFDCLPHDLLIAKLHAYGVDSKSLRILSSYLTNRKQRVRIWTFYSSWCDILVCLRDPF